MAIQFDVVTRKTLVDAMANPDKYPELLVRVSGHTDYFTHLTPEMQKDIIDRTEYQLSFERMVIHDPFALPSRWR